MNANVSRSVYHVYALFDEMTADRHTVLVVGEVSIPKYESLCDTASPSLDHGRDVPYSTTVMIIIIHRN